MIISLVSGAGPPHGLPLGACMHHSCGFQSSPAVFRRFNAELDAKLRRNWTPSSGCDVWQPCCAVRVRIRRLALGGTRHCGLFASETSPAGTGLGFGFRRSALSVGVSAVITPLGSCRAVCMRCSESLGTRGSRTAVVRSLSFKPLKKKKEKKKWLKLMPAGFGERVCVTQIQCLFHLRSSH